jgi:hypothetical protein
LGCAGWKRHETGAQISGKNTARAENVKFFTNFSCGRGGQLLNTLLNFAVEVTIFGV